MMTDNMQATGAEETGEQMPEEQENEICLHVLDDGSFDVDGEPAQSLGEAMKLIIAKVRSMQDGAGAADEQAEFEDGFKSARGSM